MNCGVGTYCTMDVRRIRFILLVWQWQPEPIAGCPVPGKVKEKVGNPKNVWIYRPDQHSALTSIDDE